MLSTVFYMVPLVPVGIFLGTLLLLLIVPVFALAALALVLLIGVAALLALAVAAARSSALLVRAARHPPRPEPGRGAVSAAAPSAGPAATADLAGLDRSAPRPGGQAG